MLLKREWQIAKAMARMHFSRYQSFRMDSFLLFISNLIFLIGTIVFWYVVNDVGFIVDGWTYAQILVFIALSELFYTFEQNIFSVAALFWQVIYTGSIDTQLIRPMDPRKRFLLLNIDYLGLLVGFVKVFLILRIQTFTWSRGNYSFPLSWSFSPTTH